VAVAEEAVPFTKSPAVDKESIRLSVLVLGVSALNLLQCFVAVGYISGRASGLKIQCHLSPKVLS